MYDCRDQIGGRSQLLTTRDRLTLLVKAFAAEIDAVLATSDS